MRLDDPQPETPAQWLEHSEAWRYAHLDLAPSDYLREMAILEHQRLLLVSASGPSPARRRWRAFRHSS